MRLLVVISGLGLSLEEPGVQDVSNVLRDLCEVQRLTLW